MTSPYSGASPAGAQHGYAEPASDATTQQNYTADYKAKARSPKFIDTVNYPRSQP